MATWPNRVTTVRLVGTAILAVVTVQMAIGSPAPAAQLSVAVIGLVCVILDGVDGWLARRLDQATDFGARYDVEVDAATVMVLSIALLVCGIGGWWVLLLGGWRYGYVLAQLVAPALRRPLPHRYSRKVIGASVAGSQIGVLVLDAVGVPSLVTTVVMAATLAVLSWSFIRDIRDQVRVAAPC